jgi:hypothetical protein
VTRSDSAESIERMLHASSGSASLVRRAKRWIKQTR